MDYEFFQSLSHEQGQEFLERYLTLESEGFAELIPAMEANGVVVDFSLASIPGVFGWILEKLHTVKLPPDDDVEWWIRQTDSYENSLVEFDEPSSVFVMRASYYLGESFARQFDCLSWGLGDDETLEGNMPVVRGFLHELELAPIIVTENVMHRTLRHKSGTKEIEEAIEAWLVDVPT